MTLVSLQYEQLKAQIFAFLDDEDIEEFDANEELIDYGLDSIQIMSLVSQWKNQGLDVSFQELANASTLNGWWDLIQTKLTQGQPSDLIRTETV